LFAMQFFIPQIFSKKHLTYNSWSSPYIPYNILP
jgi:hypothetical protein